MQIAKLKPLSLEKWGPLITALKAGVSEVRRSQLEVFKFSVFWFSPRAEVLVSKHKHGVRVRLNLGGGAKALTRRAENLILVLGFQRLAEQPGEYVRYFASVPNDEVLGKLILDLARESLGLREGGYFSFGESRFEQNLAASDAFWHYRGNPSVLCLIGQNWNETVEGLTESPFD